MKRVVLAVVMVLACAPSVMAQTTQQNAGPATIETQKPDDKKPIITEVEKLMLRDVFRNADDANKLLDPDEIGRAMAQLIKDRQKNAQDKLKALNDMFLPINARGGTEWVLDMKTMEFVPAPKKEIK